MNEADFKFNKESTIYHNGYDNYVFNHSGIVGDDSAGGSIEIVEPIPNGVDDTTSLYGSHVSHSDSGSVSGGDSSTVSTGDIETVVQEPDVAEIIIQLHGINQALMLILCFMLFVWTGRKFCTITDKFSNRRKR